MPSATAFLARGPIATIAGDGLPIPSSPTAAAGQAGEAISAQPSVPALYPAYLAVGNL